MSEHTTVTLLEERACPSCGASSDGRAIYITEPTLCPKCSLRDSLRRSLRSASSAAWYCPVCRVDVSLPWKPKHEASKNHKLMVRLALPPPPPIVVALEERGRAVS
ncbi:MAG TPA: hypothetical protein VFG76_08205 [Candidatus Polarisedimenticolia bacterium]|nr:hypothetical protein [Candidatus Polarisedimenticolia bacterium]